MSNFNKMVAMIDGYLTKYDIDISIKSDIHRVSYNDSEKVYAYSGKILSVIDMDSIAKKGYRLIKMPFSKTEDDSVNSVDAFIIDKGNEWFFIEFKDAPIKSSKESILKKAYSNWYMIMDMIFEMRGNENEYFDFDYNNPIKFAKEHVTYIIVCTLEKNPDIYRMIKNNDRTGKKYTAPFLERIKAYLFKDAYIYTEKYLERKFVKNFEY